MHPTARCGRARERAHRLALVAPCTLAEASQLIHAPEELERRLGRWAFLGRPPEEREREAGPGWSYRTRSVEPSLVTIGNSRVLLHNDDVLLACRKRAGQTSFQSTILIGRAASNDVVIAHSSISKLHARLELNELGGTISDAGSSNGTALDDKRLVPDQPSPVTSGSLLTFGSCSFVLVSLEYLLQMFARLPR